MKKFCIFLLTIIIFFSIHTMVLGRGGGREINAVDMRTKYHFKPNKALSDYLDTQGFKVGLSRNEAISYYKFDKTGRGSAEYKYWRSDMADIDGIYVDPKEVGFYEGNFLDDQGQLTNNLCVIKKCIVFVKEKIKGMEIGHAFGEKFGIDYQSELCLNHHGRYIVFDFQVIELRDSRSRRRTDFAAFAVVISLQDITEKLIEIDKSEKDADNATERVKKEMDLIVKPPHPDDRPVIFWRD
jgi:hypothetical protein